MIDEAGQGSLFYRLVISPDPRTEDAERDLHLRDIIEKTMLYLEDRFQKAVPFVAAEHDDHSPHRHTHILAVLPGRLSTQDLAALRGGRHRSRAVSEAGAGSGPDAADTRAACHAIAAASSPSGATTLERARQGSRTCRLEARAGEGGYRRDLSPLWSSAWIAPAHLCQLRPETAQERGEGGRVGTVAATLSQLLYGPQCIIGTRLYGSRFQERIFAHTQGHVAVSVDREIARPDVIAGEIDVVPAERRELRDQPHVGGRAACPQPVERPTEIAAVEQDDGGGHEVERRRAEL